MYIKPRRSVLNSQPVKSIAIVAVLLAAFGIAGHFDAEEEQRQQDEYCEMVKLWKQTNGQSGWPAYNGEGMCK